MARKVDKNLNAELVDFINKLMKEISKDPEAKLLDKLRVVDRALALEKIKQKIEDDQWGAGFQIEDDGTDD
jgi:tripartite-type tricarboxylate transporter receptor subunit TctC